MLGLLGGAPNPKSCFLAPGRACDATNQWRPTRGCRLHFTGTDLWKIFRKIRVAGEQNRNTSHRLVSTKAGGCLSGAAGCTIDTIREAPFHTHFFFCFVAFSHSRPVSRE